MSYDNWKTGGVNPGWDTELQDAPTKQTLAKCMYCSKLYMTYPEDKEVFCSKECEDYFEQAMRETE